MTEMLDIGYTHDTDSGVMRSDYQPAGFTRALATFQRAARHVPAYADFLHGHGVDVAAVRTPTDFAEVPPVTKDNYLRRYPLDELMWQGDVTGAGTWSTSSGSSGTPTYWPRADLSLADGVDLYARLFRLHYGTLATSTLLVIGFAMGDWIGGTYTYAAAAELRRRGHRLSVIAPGIDADTILADIAALGPYYRQVVLAGYPPFVKDVLDRAPEAVLRQDIKVLLAGENITERWRDQLLARLGKPDRAADVSLVYGTADAGIMGHETPTTIALRRAAMRDPLVRHRLFGAGPADDPLPTFAEYDPELRFIEAGRDGYLLFTVDTAIPLIRYRINDRGRVLDEPGAHYVVLGQRADVAASFYAVKIYPGPIRAAVEDDLVAGALTGRFVVAVDDAGPGPRLLLRVELREGAGVDAELIGRVREQVVAHLCAASAEYRRLHVALGAAAEPVVNLCRHGSTGFGGGPKHRWTGAVA